MVISDTSSVSNLLQVGQIDLLRRLFGSVVITPAVRRELFVLETQQHSLTGLTWLKVEAPSNHKLVMQLLTELDLGESESIALALERDAEYLIIDEYRGRMIAETYGIRIVGVLGLLIKAKQEGLIPSVKDEVDKLLRIGFRLSKGLATSVLRRLGEL